MFMKNNKQALFLTLLFVCGPSSIRVQALESGAEFLKIGTDAKAMAMGSAYTAAASGTDALYYNPAGLSGTKGYELAFSHANWLLDSRHDFVGFAFPLKLRGRQLGGGLGVTRLSNAGMEGRGADRSAGGSFDSYDQAVSLALGARSGGYSFGLGGKYIESSIAGEKAKAFAIDLGVNRSLNNLPVSIGFAVQNLGTPMKYMTQRDPLPVSIAAGLMLEIIPGFNITLDTRRLLHEKSNVFSVGSDYSFMPGFALRTGYMINNVTAIGGLGGFSGGVGMTLFATQLDYSITPFAGLGNAQKISLKKKFGPSPK